MLIGVAKKLLAVPWRGSTASASKELTSRSSARAQAIRGARVGEKAHGARDEAGDARAGIVQDSRRSLKMSAIHVS